MLAAISAETANVSLLGSAWRKPCKIALSHIVHPTCRQSLGTPKGERRSRPRWAERGHSRAQLVAHEREHAVAQKANAAKRERYTHKKSNGRSLSSSAMAGGGVLIPSPLS